jgi:anti-sigma regulatory factor (Ser/Thr protein kinase)
LLGIGEAVANAIEHGSSRDASQIVKVEIAIRDDEVIASVTDSGRWRPGVDGYFSGRGRGHLIMQSLLDDVDIDTDAQGTIVTLLLSLQGTRV